MQEFTIKGNQGFIRMELQKASDFLQNTNNVVEMMLKGLLKLRVEIIMY